MDIEYDIFISYAHEDSEYAKNLQEDLKKKKLNCFMAETSIQVGEKWEKYILNALENSRQIIFLITKNYLDNYWMRIEQGAAWALKKKMITALINVPKNYEIDYLLRNRQSVDISLPREYNDFIKNIAAMREFSYFWIATLATLATLEGSTLDKKLYIVFSGKDGQDFVDGKHTGRKGHSILISYKEFNSFLKLQNKLKSIIDKEDVRVVHGKKQEKYIFPKEENLIVIGSIHANDICKEIFEKEECVGLPYQFKKMEFEEEINKDKKNSIKYIMDEKNKCFPSNALTITLEEDKSLEERPKEDLKEDFGIIMRIRNPFNSENTVLILGGNHGFGTEAAVKFVSDSVHVKSLHAIVSKHDFQAIFRITISEENKSEELSLIKLVILEKDKWIDKTKKIRKV